MSVFCACDEKRGMNSSVFPAESDRMTVDAMNVREQVSYHEQSGGEARWK